MKKLNDNLLTHFMNGFFGYGNLKADFWMIAMEEGGGETLDEIDMRLRVWEQRGKQLVEDIVEYHNSIGKINIDTH